MGILRGSEILLDRPGGRVTRRRGHGELVDEAEGLRLVAPLVDVGAGYVEPPRVEREATRLLGLADERIAPQVLELEEDVQLPDLVVRGELRRRPRAAPVALE